VESRRKRVVAIGAVAALAAAGGGVAYAAATGGQSQRDALLRDAAQRLDVSPDKLRAALEGALADQLAQAVRDGRLTQQQADRIKQRIQQGGVPLGGPGFGPGRVGGPLGLGPGAVRIGLDAAAGYLGLARADLLRALRSGKTLAQVARAQGKSVDGLQQALLDAAEAELDRALASRRVTQAQHDAILRGLQQRIADVVNGRGPRMGMRFGLRGGPGGPPPWGGPPPGHP